MHILGPEHAMYLTVILNMPSGPPRSVESAHVKVIPVTFTDSAESYTTDTTKVTGLKLPSTDSSDDGGPNDMFGIHLWCIMHVCNAQYSKYYASTWRPSWRWSPNCTGRCTMVGCILHSNYNSMALHAVVYCTNLCKSCFVQNWSWCVAECLSINN